MMNTPPLGGRPNKQQIDGDQHDVMIFSDNVGAFCICGQMHEESTIVVFVGTGTALLTAECPKGHRLGQFIPPMGYQLN